MINTSTFSVLSNNGIIIGEISIPETEITMIQETVYIGVLNVFTLNCYFSVAADDKSKITIDQYLTKGLLIEANTRYDPDITKQIEGSNRKPWNECVKYKLYYNPHKLSILRYKDGSITIMPINNKPLRIEEFDLFNQVV